MEPAPPGTGGQNQPESADRRVWPSPLQWAVAILLIATLALTIALVRILGDDGRPSAAESARTYTEAPPQGPTVSLAIDFGNGVTREFAHIAWREGMTARDLMQATSLMAPGLAYEVSGSGEMALLTSVDGVANGAGAGRYWLYEVNGALAKVSFAAQPLASGDRVLWKFARAR